MSSENLLPYQEWKEYEDLWASDMAKKKGKRTISPSALMTLMGCELKYFFSYVKNWRIKVKAPPLALVSSFHAAAEHLNREQALGRKVTKQDLFDVYDVTWAQETDGCEFKSAKDEMAQRDTGLRLIDKYMNSTRRKQFTPTVCRAEGDHDAWIPAVEMEISAPFIDLFTGEELKDGWLIRGFIDVVKVADKDIPSVGVRAGDSFVADYKTSRSEFSDFSVQMNLQILMYAYGIRHMMKQVPDLFPEAGSAKDREDWVGIICLVKRKDPVIKHIMVKVTDEEIRYLQDLVLKALNRIEAGIFLPTGLNNPTMNCGWCEFKEPCKGLRMGKNPEEWWAKNRQGYRNTRSTVS